MQPSLYGRAQPPREITISHNSHASPEYTRYQVEQATHNIEREYGVRVKLQRKRYEDYSPPTQSIHYNEAQNISQQFFGDF